MKLMVKSNSKSEERKQWLPFLFHDWNEVYILIQIDDIKSESFKKKYYYTS